MLLTNKQQAFIIIVVFNQPEARIEHSSMNPIWRGRIYTLLLDRLCPGLFIGRHAPIPSTLTSSFLFPAAKFLPKASENEIPT